MNGAMVVVYLVMGMIIGAFIGFFGKFLIVYFSKKKENGLPDDKKSEPGD